MRHTSHDSDSEAAQSLPSWLRMVNAAAVHLACCGKGTEHRASAHFSAGARESHSVEFPSCLSESMCFAVGWTDDRCGASCTKCLIRVSQGSRCWRWRCGWEGGSLKVPFTAFTDRSLEALAILCVRFEQVNDDFAEVEKSFF